MRRVRSVLVVLGLVGSLVLLGPATTACACSCAPAEPPQSWHDAEVVFVGVVRKVDQPWQIFGGSSADPVQVSLDVSLVHKDLPGQGGVTATTRVSTAVGGASCGYPFVPGHTYLVFARSRAGGGPAGDLQTTVCSGNRDLALEADPFAGGGPPAPNPPRSAWSALTTPAAVVSGVVLASVAVVLAVLVYRRRAQKSA